jgi:hypothetical protein
MSGTDSVLPLTYACHRCGKTFGTYQGRNIHHTLIHKAEAMADVAEGNRIREAHRAALAPLNLQGASIATLEAVGRALSFAINDGALTHEGDEERCQRLLDAIDYSLTGGTDVTH